MDNLDFLDGQEPAPDAAPQPEAAPSTEPAEAQGQPRGPDGKFAPKDAAPPQPAAEPQPSPPAAQPPASQQTPEGFVPLSAFTQLRSEFNDYKRQQTAPQPQQAPPPIPDPYEDPEGFAAWQDQRMQSAIYSQTLAISRRFAETQHGAETVQTAFDWGAQRCDVDPFFNAKVRSSDDPIGFVVAEWKREQLFSKLSDPAQIDQFVAWQAQQAAGAPQIAAPAVPPPQAPQVPPRSIASAPNAGGAKPGETPIDPAAAFQSVFQ